MKDHPVGVQPDVFSTSVKTYLAVWFVPACLDRARSAMLHVTKTKMWKIT